MECAGNWRGVHLTCVCARTMAERLHKYAEVHSLDSRANTEKDAALRSQQDELSRLRAQLTGPGR